MNDIVCVPYYVLEYICFLAGVDSHTVTDQCSVIDPACFDEIVPQSEDYVDSEQNVVFHDADPGHVGGTMGTIDDIRDEVMVSDASLQDFFSRPITIASYNWTVNGGLDADIWPWEEYFKNPRVSNRISNFKLLSCKLCVKVLVNGTPFHYGRVLMSYTPMSNYDDLTIARTGISADLVGLSQMPHIFIDPTTSEGGELHLPFLWWKNSIDITTSSFSPSGFNEFKQMGQLRLRTLNPLRHVNGGTENVSIRVFAWAEDVKMAVPTSINPEFLLSQAGTIVPNSEEIVPHAKGGKPKARDEYTGGGIISAPATVVASIARKLADAPVIGKYARATEIGASSLANIASLFGFSRPAMLTAGRYRRETKSGMAVTNIEDDVVKLSVDTKQELSIDPSIFGLNDVDEMEIKYLAQKESYLTKFIWGLDRPPESQLFQTVVDPGLKDFFNNEYHLTALGFVQVPFKLWRGTIRFRFQVVCSAYHRGRLKFVYDPEKIADNTIEYNTAYTTIVDISNGSDFTIDVGWGQPFSYTNTLPFSTPVGDTFTDSGSPLFYAASEQEWGNGVLGVYVVNELTAPTTEINNAEINVYISAGDDFEVAMPTGETLTRLRYRSVEDEHPPVVGDIEPQSEEVMGSKDTSSPPISADTDAASLSLTDAANLVHFGESIRSFRQLVKRYNRHETIPIVDGTVGTNTATYLTVQRPIMPFEGGRTDKGGILPPVVVAGGVPYVYANLTLVRYLASAFVGWRGGMRYLVDFPELCCGENLGPASIGRYDSCVPENFNFALGANSRDSGFQSTESDVNDDVAGMEGFYVQNMNNNRTIAFEAPFYSKYRFMPGRLLQSFNQADGTYGPCWKLRFPFFNTNGTVNNAKSVRTYVAAAEDFTVGMFLAAPVVYFESSPPT